MMVSGGYPDSYSKGFPVSGVEKVSESILFHAGTTMKDGRLVTSGGRVIAVTSMGSTMQRALDRSYSSVREITFNGMNYRKDIGSDLKNQIG
jgi:phosphoribosylamine--glycine ligase